jgi:hypothetical protein
VAVTFVTTRATRTTSTCSTTTLGRCDDRRRGSFANMRGIRHSLYHITIISHHHDAATLFFGTVLDSTGFSTLQLTLSITCIVTNYKCYTLTVSYKMSRGYHGQTSS